MKKQILIGVLVLLAAALVVLATPVINTIGAKTINEGETLTFDVTVSLHNGSVIYSLATGAPSWASIVNKDDNVT
ncbi:hypothetical protein KY317_01335, partial [Candidatus Woesearchaeota archaeon]|nr:hypothetical protein [Candidatus Woesearchaeota archaeon]